MQTYIHLFFCVYFFYKISSWFRKVMIWRQLRTCRSLNPMCLWVIKLCEALCHCLLDGSQWKMWSFLGRCKTCKHVYVFSSRISKLTKRIVFSSVHLCLSSAAVDRSFSICGDVWKFSNSYKIDLDFYETNFEIHVVKRFSTVKQ